MAQRLVLAAFACVLAVSESVVVIKTSGSGDSNRAKKSGCVGAACKGVVFANEKNGAARSNASLVNAANAALAGRDAEFKQSRRLEETIAGPVAVAASTTCPFDQTRAGKALLYFAGMASCTSGLGAGRSWGARTGGRGMSTYYIVRKAR